MPKIIVPVVTVFDHNGKPDREDNRKVSDFLIRNGVDGILVLGSTGEFTELTVAEKRDLLQTYAEDVAGRTELYAGTGSLNFHQTLELSQAVYDMGYRAPMVIGPYYYGLDQAHLFTYYDTLAKHLQRDMYIYNFPARSGHSIAADTVRRLAEANPNIIGLKDSVSAPSHTNEICRAVEGLPFEVYSGFDDQYLYNLSSGGAGSIGGLANVVPDIWSDLIRSTKEQNFGRVIKLTNLLHRLMPIYDMGFSSSLLFKKLLVFRGVDISPKAIFPFDESDNAAFEAVKGLLADVLAEYGRM
ncbi:MAG: dihydrodipicolinate synthase family protein [Ruminococcaceae bacterium]|nr:dihydrodipicolinate synthase family protein [Oscillospiraceae bacterium]